jgi:ParB family transcriptional regulator, chromosome partitioning protein
MIKEKRPALGRGLDALLGSASPAPPQMGDGAMFTCPIERIRPMKAQPRQAFPDKELDELASSLKEHGVLQPVVVRKVAGDGAGDSYELVMGERRWRAAQRAGLHEIPVVLRDVTPSEAFLQALVENLQRTDLNPVELAEGIDRMMREGGLTHEDVAERLGKDRTTIANTVRLLKLPARVRQMVIDGALTEGHARALLGAPDPKVIELLAEKISRGRLSVREAERLVRARVKPKADGGAGGGKSPSVRDLEERLSRKLGTKVEVRDKSGKGEIAIRYASLDELDRLLDLLMK